MKQRKTNQAGRSMLEMLGVLAIVGILSVGGIFGYNKAVLKIKLNRQAEQYTQLITNIPLLLNQKELSQTDNVNLTHIIIKAGVIPQEMIIKKNSTYLYDALGNRVSIGRERFFFKITTERSNDIVDYNTCFNLLQLSKELSPILWQTHLGLSTSENKETTNSIRGFGDIYCRSGLTCLKDLTPEKIIEFCQTCSFKRTKCYIRMLWK